ncbi:hypothetical protein ACXYMX_08975 [Sporosarcina sp. CAU 1771]
MKKMVSNTEEKIELNNLKLTAMKFKVLHLEKLNVKTKERTKGEMVESIRKIIAEEINKNI